MVMFEQKKMNWIRKGPKRARGELEDESYKRQKSVCKKKIENRKDGGKGGPRMHDDIRTH